MHAGMNFYSSIKDGIVANKRAAHRLWVLFPQLGAAFDVGQQECDGARRQLFMKWHRHTLTLSVWQPNQFQNIAFYEESGFLIA